jgi:hypothetical protein
MRPSSDIMPTLINEKHRERVLVLGGVNPPPAISETKKTGSFTIPGIGKLVLQKRKARKRRNPATGESIKIPTKMVVKMRIAKTCKDAVLPARGK